MAPRKEENRLNIGRVRIPPKPKRALNGYTAFVKDYWMKNRSKITQRKNGKPSTRDAHKQWTRLDSISRKTFSILAKKDHDRYITEMKSWRVQRQYLKRPANAYALFVKEQWAKAPKKNLRNSFSHMSKRISKEWQKTPSASRTELRERYKNNMRAHLTKLNDMRIQGTLLEDDDDDFQDEIFDPKFLEDLNCDDNKEKENSSVMDVCVPRDKCISKKFTKPEMVKITDLQNVCPEDT